MAMYYLVEQNGEHFYVDAGGRRVPEENLKGDFTSVNYDADLSSSKVKTITQSGKFGYQTLDGQPLVDCVLDYDIKTAQGFVDAMSSLKAKYIQLIQQHPENKAKLRQELEQEVKNLHGARLKIIAHMQKLEREANAEKETAKTPSNTTETVSPAETNNTTTTTTTPVTTTESSSQTKTPLGNGITMLRDTQGHYGYEDKDGNIFIPCDLPIDVSAPSKTYNASVTKLFEECKVKLNSCTPSEKQALINEYKQLSERIQTARQAYNSKVKELKTSNSTSTATAETATAKTAEPSTTDTNKVAETKASTSETNGAKANTNNDSDSTAEYVTIVRYDHINNILTVMDKAGKTKSYFSSHFFEKEQVYIVDDGLDVLAEGVISKDGKIVVPCIKGTDIKPFNDGFAIIKRNGKYGYINSKGDEILKCIYDTIEFFGSTEANLTCVKLNGKWGVINRKGDMVVECIYGGDAIGLLRDNTIAIKKDGKWAIADQEGKLVTKGYIYDDIYQDNHNIKEGYVPVKQDGKWGMVNSKNGELVVKCLYELDDMELLDGGLVGVRKDGKWGIVNKDGELATKDYIYDFMISYHEGFVRVRKDGKWGLVNKDGKPVVDCIYEDSTKAFDFIGEDLLRVENNGKFGIVNQDGELITKDYIYETVGRFSEGLAYVEKDGKWGVIDTAGKEVVKCTLTRNEVYEVIDKIIAGTFNPEDYKQETVGANSKRNTGITGDDKSLTDGDEGVTSDGEDVTDCDDGVTGDGGITA